MRRIFVVLMVAGSAVMAACSPSGQIGLTSPVSGTSVSLGGLPEKASVRFCTDGGEVTVSIGSNLVDVEVSLLEETGIVPAGGGTVSSSSLALGCYTVFMETLGDYVGCGFGPCAHPPPALRFNYVVSW